MIPVNRQASLKKQHMAPFLTNRQDLERDAGGTEPGGRRSGVSRARGSGTGVPDLSAPFPSIGGRMTCALLLSTSCQKQERHQSAGRYLESPAIQGLFLCSCSSASHQALLTGSSCSSPSDGAQAFCSIWGSLRLQVRINVISRASLWRRASPLLDRYFVSDIVKV